MDINSQTLNISEHLNVSQVDIPEIPKDIIFPDELNRFFKEQIRYYVHENGMLQKNLSDTELDYNKCKTKINELETKLKHFEKLTDGNDILNSTQVASIKIVELSKKLREKNSEVEVLKTKNSKLEQHVYQLQHKPEDHKETGLPFFFVYYTAKNIFFQKEKKKPVNELEETVKKLQEKLNHMTNKMLETKNTNLQLKNDLKLANKWLQQEIGENFESVQSLNNNGNWRGRSQIICDLQQKNAELREKIKESQEKHITLTSNKTDSKILRKKYDALRARCKVLDTDYTLLKSKFTMMKEQSERDQDIISTLSSQISNTRDIKNDVLQQKDLIINKIQKDKNILCKEIDEYKSITKKIQGRNNSKNIGRLEVERQRLLELVEVQNKRLNSERDAHSKTQHLLRYEKQRAAKAEANAARVELESSTSRSSGYSTSSIRPLDLGIKDQLELAEENIKALKTRLEIEHFERKSDLQEFTKILRNYDYEESQMNL
ncbi:hypothetical protein NQ314_006363 [Rhamnusium bicolor]|uniref:Coiled-coil domain-containing protein 13 n=1 Tax=Rhamnusium bicolor TaxID=1586634 RepID=A0AAV8Z3S2_9CUCU|nr:hypothetical protein NQ314_006363 [Rhamnusium bicolor]